MHPETNARDDEQLLSDEQGRQPAQRSVAAKPAQSTPRLGNSPSVEIQASSGARPTGMSSIADAGERGAITSQASGFGLQASG
jgi:hypothetical protein